MEVFVDVEVPVVALLFEVLTVEATIPFEPDPEPGIGSGIAVDPPVPVGLVTVEVPVLAKVAPVVVSLVPVLVLVPVEGVGLLRAGPFGFSVDAVSEVDDPTAGTVELDVVVEVALVEIDGAVASIVRVATVVEPPTFGNVWVDVSVPF